MIWTRIAEAFTHFVTWVTSKLPTITIPDIDFTALQAVMAWATAFFPMWVIAIIVGEWIVLLVLWAAIIPFRFIRGGP